MGISSNSNPINNYSNRMQQACNQLVNETTEGRLVALRLLGFDAIGSDPTASTADITERIAANYSVSEVEAMIKLASIWTEIEDLWVAEGRREASVDRGASQSTVQDPLLPADGSIGLRPEAIDKRLNAICQRMGATDPIVHDIKTIQDQLPGHIVYLLDEIEHLASDLGYKYTFKRSKLDRGNYIGLMKNLRDLAESLGYKTDPERGESLGSLDALDELFYDSDMSEKGLEEVAQILYGALKALDIQSDALGELFGKLDKADLVRAAQAQLTAADDLPKQGNRMWMEMKIEDTPFYATFFPKDGAMEYLLVCETADANRKGADKQYRAAGTIADIEDVAHLQIKFQVADPRGPLWQTKMQKMHRERTQLTEATRSDIAKWKNLLRHNVRHVPRFITFREKLNEIIILAEGYDHDVSSLLAERGQEEGFREKLFHIIAPTLLEHLSDAHHYCFANFDIKPANTLIRLDKKTGEPIKAAVIDFAFLRQMFSKTSRDINPRGTIAYLDPAFGLKRNGGLWSDIWSAGSSFAEIRYGKPLTFCINTSRGVRSSTDKYPAQEQVIQKLEEISGKSYEEFDHYDWLILHMLHVEPRKRFSASEALKMYRTNPDDTELPK